MISINQIQCRKFLGLVHNMGVFFPNLFFSHTHSLPPIFSTLCLSLFFHKLIVINYTKELDLPHKCQDPSFSLCLPQA